MDRRSAKKNLRSFLRFAKESDMPIEDVIVFGSFARGMETKDSDLDLCFIFSSRTKNVDSYLAQLSFKAGRDNLPFDITGTTLKEFRTNTLSPFLHEVRTYGIRASDFLA